jgi:CRISPR-associated protein Cmr3
MIWYELTPFDTLFFRGGIPFETGLPVSDVLFPPPPSVIAGAVWTAGRQDFSKKPTVKVGATLLKKKDKYYAQAPHSWFISKSGEILGAEEFNDKDSICSVNTPIPWIEGDAKNIGGEWIDITMLEKSDNKTYKKEDFIDNEDRVGISVDYNKKSVEEGKLFTARHIRLRKDVTIAVAIDGEYGLGEKGVLRLGGESRMCSYQKIKVSPPIPNVTNSKYFVALAPVLCTEERKEEFLSKVFAAKTFAVSGWDMKEKTHKASQTWFYAGSVFTEKIGDQCIALS